MGGGSGIHYSFKVFASRKRLRAKYTPDLHLTYSKTRGFVGLK